MLRRREGREYAKKLMMIILFSKPNREGKPVIEIIRERRIWFIHKCKNLQSKAVL